MAVFKIWDGPVHVEYKQSKSVPRPSDPFGPCHLDDVTKSSDDKGQPAKDECLRNTRRSPLSISRQRKREYNYSMVQNIQDTARRTRVHDAIRLHNGQMMGCMYADCIKDMKVILKKYQDLDPLKMDTDCGSRLKQYLIDSEIDYQATYASLCSSKQSLKQHLKRSPRCAKKHSNSFIFEENALKPLQRSGKYTKRPSRADVLSDIDSVGSDLEVDSSYEQISNRADARSLISHVNNSNKKSHNSESLNDMSGRELQRFMGLPGLSNSKDKRASKAPTMVKSLFQRRLAKIEKDQPRRQIKKNKKKTGKVDPLKVPPTDSCEVDDITTAKQRASVSSSSHENTLRSKIVAANAKISASSKPLESSESGLHSASQDLHLGQKYAFVFEKRLEERRTSKSTEHSLDVLQETRGDDTASEKETKQTARKNSFSKNTNKQNMMPVFKAALPHAVFDKFISPQEHQKDKILKQSGSLQRKMLPKDPDGTDKKSRRKHSTLGRIDSDFGAKKIAEITMLSSYVHYKFNVPEDMDANLEHLSLHGYLHK